MNQLVLILLICASLTWARQRSECGKTMSCFIYGDENCVDAKTCKIFVSFKLSEDGTKLDFHLTTNQVDNSYAAYAYAERNTNTMPVLKGVVLLKGRNGVILRAIKGRGQGPGKPDEATYSVAGYTDVSTDDHGDYLEAKYTRPITPSNDDYMYDLNNKFYTVYAMGPVNGQVDNIAYHGGNRGVSDTSSTLVSMMPPKVSPAIASCNDNPCYRYPADCTNEANCKIFFKFTISQSNLDCVFSTNNVDNGFSIIALNEMSNFVGFKGVILYKDSNGVKLKAVRSTSDDAISTKDAGDAGLLNVITSSNTGYIKATFSQPIVVTGSTYLPDFTKMLYIIRVTGNLDQNGGFLYSQATRFIETTAQTLIQTQPGSVYQIPAIDSNKCGVDYGCFPYPIKLNVFNFYFPYVNDNSYIVIVLSTRKSWISLTFKGAEDFYYGVFAYVRDNKVMFTGVRYRLNPNGKIVSWMPQDNLPNGYQYLSGVYSNGLLLVAFKRPYELPGSDLTQSITCQYAYGSFNGNSLQPSNDAIVESTTINFRNIAKPNQVTFQIPNLISTNCGVNYGCFPYPIVPQSKVFNVYYQYSGNPNEVVIVLSTTFSWVSLAFKGEQDYYYGVICYLSNGQVMLKGLKYKIGGNGQISKWEVQPQMTGYQYLNSGYYNGRLIVAFKRPYLLIGSNLNQPSVCEYGYGMFNAQNQPVGYQIKTTTIDFVNVASALPALELCGTSALGCIPLPSSGSRLGNLNALITYSKYEANQNYIILNLISRNDWILLAFQGPGGVNSYRGILVYKYINNGEKRLKISGVTIQGSNLQPVELWEGYEEVYQAIQVIGGNEVIICKLRRPLTGGSLVDISSTVSTIYSAGLMLLNNVMGNAQVSGSLVVNFLDGVPATQPTVPPSIPPIPVLRFFYSREQGCNENTFGSCALTVGYAVGQNTVDFYIVSSRSTGYVVFAFNKEKSQVGSKGIIFYNMNGEVRIMGYYHHENGTRLVFDLPDVYTNRSAVVVPGVNLIQIALEVDTTDIDNQMFLYNFYDYLYITWLYGPLLANGGFDFINIVASGISEQIILIEGGKTTTTTTTTTTTEPTTTTTTTESTTTTTTTTPTTTTTTPTTTTTTPTTTTTTPTTTTTTPTTTTTTPTTTTTTPTTTTTTPTTTTTTPTTTTTTPTTTTTTPTTTTTTPTITTTTPTTTTTTPTTTPTTPTTTTTTPTTTTTTPTTTTTTPTTTTTTPTTTTTTPTTTTTTPTTTTTTPTTTTTTPTTTTTTPTTTTTTPTTTTTTPTTTTTTPTTTTTTPTTTTTTPTTTTTTPATTTTTPTTTAQPEIENSCLKKPCRNGLSCVPGAGTAFKCICPYTYARYVCLNNERNKNPCDTPNICRDGYDCKRVEGRSYFCQKEKPCETNPCRNDGICSTVVKGMNGFAMCMCQPNYGGPNCQIGNACAEEPCLNDGTCVASTVSAGFECDCEPGYFGRLCQYEKKIEVYTGPTASTRAPVSCDLNYVCTSPGNFAWEGRPDCFYRCGAGNILAGCHCCDPGQRYAQECDRCLGPQESCPATTTTTTTTPKPTPFRDLSNFCKYRYGLMKDPDYPQNFIHCSNFIPYVKTCPAGLFWCPFTEVTGVCGPHPQNFGDK